MNRPLLIVALGAALVGAIAAGYWLGQRAPSAPANAAAAAGESAQPARKLLYYRNPMGLPDTSPVPKKDPMGMDYLPVYEGEDANRDPTLRFSAGKVQKLGVRTAKVMRQELPDALSAVGRVEIDERRLATVAPKFEAWIERLHVNTVGQQVRRGEVLAEVYSPELVSAQREYLLAWSGERKLSGASPEARAAMRQLAEASLTRLANWDIGPEQLQRLREQGEVSRSLALRAPASGVVTERKAVAGMRFMPGDMLYQIADLATVWVIADVFEQDIARIARGDAATVRVNAYPGRAFAARVAYIYPTLNPSTRSVPVRLELANPGGALKPAMYAEVSISPRARGAVLTVPAAAVLHSGKRELAIVALGEGRYEPREVTLGRRGDTEVEIRSGLKEGETVVAAGNFLIDAESNLRAALGGLGAVSTHNAEGRIERIDLGQQSLAIAHGPVPSLDWPAMSMEFKVREAALLQGLKPGMSIAFEFREGQPGEWLLVSRRDVAPKHAGHKE